MKYGVGFRQFLDIAMMTKNCKELDWKVIEKNLREIDLLSFAQTVCEYNKRWFGVNSPFDQIKLSDEEFEKSTDYIFKNGVFGFDNKENTKQVQMIRSRKKKYPFLYMCKNALYKLFLPYKRMVEFDYCSFLRDKPILLPIAWMKRLYRYKKKGVKKGIKQISNSFVFGEFIAQREEMFKKWGLL